MFEQVQTEALSTMLPLLIWYVLYTPPYATMLLIYTGPSLAMHWIYLS